MSSWIKENKQSFLVLSIGGAAFLGIVVWGFLQGQQESETYQKMTSDASSIENIASSPKPSHDNVLKQMKAAEAEVIERYNLIEAEMLPYQENCDPEKIDITPSAFLSEVKATNKALTEMAKAKNITLIKNVPWAGMTKYGMDLASDANAPYLNFELQGIRNVLDIVMASGATSISKLYRQPLEMEQGAAAASTKKPAASNAGARSTARTAMKKAQENIVMPFEISFTGDRGIVAKVLNAISSDKRYYYTITAMRVKNVLEVLPVLKVVAAEKPADEMMDALSAPAAAKGASAAPAAPTEVLQPLVGHEALTVFLALDLYYFAPPAVAPTPKTNKP